MQKSSLTFPVLSDPGLAVARRYGLVYELWEEEKAGLQRNGVDLPTFNGMETWELPVTARFVIRPDGTIAWVWADSDHRNAPDPEKILAFVREAAGD